MTPTIIPYPKFLTKPWRCMVLQAIHCRAVHRLAIHRHHHWAYINVTSPSKRPLPSRCCQAVHHQAIAPSIAKLSVAEPFIAVAVKPSIAIGLLHCRCVADKPSIAVAKLPLIVTLCCSFYESSIQTRFLKRQRGPVAYFWRILINECTDNIE